MISFVGFKKWFKWKYTYGDVWSYSDPRRKVIMTYTVSCILFLETFATSEYIYLCELEKSNYKFLQKGSNASYNAVAYLTNKEA